ncbi:MAG: glycyl-radical enzyme activating protein [Bacteroidales bacterium]|nr:glycyl-radical enzyme activating protein [Bacteroidales bacterium]
MKITEKAIIFDIQRSSLYDGPGIRTTVFLKGCPLNCLWCHNPEATDGNRQLSFHIEKCTFCGKCEDVCVNRVHQLTDGIHAIDFSQCLLCGKCVNACPSSALKIVGKWMTVDEVMQEVLADYDFYLNSGGGITISGGEPLWNLPFTLELLKRCKLVGVNTCVETSGFVSSLRFIEMLPYIDVLLFDYKMTGSAEYLKYTGVSNEVILNNLEIAHSQEVSIILRCPVIPGINDTDQHFEGILAIDRKFPNLKGIELLPYHRMGNSKRLGIGIEETLVSLETVPVELSIKWIERLNELGCSKVKLGVG